MHVHSFPPIASRKSRLLILGSMPGKASLRAGEYYAHPRNLFWDFVARSVGVERSAPYAERVAALDEAGVALWDVLEACTRASSLDSDIVESSIVVNPFGSFLAAHPGIRAVCFNGAKAEALFAKHVAPGLEPARAIRYQRLPSTSPANASIPLATKRAQWSRALRLAAPSRASEARA